MHHNFVGKLCRIGGPVTEKVDGENAFILLSELVVCLDNLAENVLNF